MILYDIIWYGMILISMVWQYHTIIWYDMLWWGLTFLHHFLYRFSPVGHLNNPMHPLHTGVRPNANLQWLIYLLFPKANLSNFRLFLDHDHENKIRLMLIFSYSTFFFDRFCQSVAFSLFTFI